MKKIFILSVMLFLTISTANAAYQVKVTAINEFNTEKPSKNINVTVREDIKLDEFDLKAGDVLKCKVVDITDPKRGKRNATFSVQPYAYISDGKTFGIKKEIVGKYSKTVLSKEELKNMPKGKLVEKAAVTVGGFYVKGLGQGVSLVEGMVKNEDGNRLESGVKQVYKDSPLSYVEKGQELDIMPGEDFYFVFGKTEDEEEDKPNYTYTEPAE